MNRFREDVDYISSSILDTLSNECGKINSYILPTSPNNLLEIKIDNSYFVVEFFLNKNSNNDPQMGVFITDGFKPDCIYQDYFTYPINEDSVVDCVVGEILDYKKQVN